MSLDPSNGRRSLSPPSSGRSSPVARLARRPEDGTKSKDKGYRRYAAGIERALATFDQAQQEWADYIAFLARLLKAVQAPHPDVDSLPEARSVALRLSQCLNPALPSGVHQKALDVYSYIFSLIGKDSLARDLHIYLPGLSPVLSFASLSVRPLFYSIFEEHILQLQAAQLRPAVKTLILALLPGIEDETSEDFERAISILDRLRRRCGSIESGGGIEQEEEEDGYFWQCFFLAIVTGVSRRQGALAYLTRRLPNFSPPKGDSTHDGVNGESKDAFKALPPSAQAVVSPEPGLLIRAFAAGLLDSQMLVQRGFLDLLVTHLPLNSPVLQKAVDGKDLERIVSAAVAVVLRREMSLNRRLWSWFLGPEKTADGADSSQPTSPADERGNPDGSLSTQLTYFQTYGADPLRNSLLGLLNRQNATVADRARPFRISLSLMDRWEVGGSIIPDVLLPALESVFKYTSTGPKEGAEEVIRSASLFFDGIESDLIWTRLIEVLDSCFNVVASDPKAAEEKLAFLRFIIDRFNVREEDMVVRHIPNALLVILSRITAKEYALSPETESFSVSMLSFTEDLLRLAPARGLNGNEQAITPIHNASGFWKSEKYLNVGGSLVKSYQSGHAGSESGAVSLDPQSRGSFIVGKLVEILLQSLEHLDSMTFVSRITSLLTMTLAKTDGSKVIHGMQLYDAFLHTLQQYSPDATVRKPVPFAVLSAIMTILQHSRLAGAADTIEEQRQVTDLEPELMAHFWEYLSPFRPKHHVETVRLIWHLESLTSSDTLVEARLTELINDSSPQKDQETVGRFSILWDYTMQAHAAKGERNARRLTRRVSTMSVMSDLGAEVNPGAVLTRPLLSLLDKLEDNEGDASLLIRTWLHNVSNLDRIFMIILSMLQDQVFASGRLSGKVPAVRQSERDRQVAQRVQDITFSLRHLYHILRHSSHRTWDVLSGLEFDPTGDGLSSSSAFEVIAQTCIKILTINSYTSDPQLHNMALSILQLLLDSPYHTTLQNLCLEDTLIHLLKDKLSRPIGSVQTVYLRCILLALRIKLEVPVPAASSKATIDASEKAPNPSANVERIDTGSIQNWSTPPPQLLDCLRSGFSSRHCRLYLEHWVDFLSSILPLYADAIFSNMIPLVECFCEQIAQAFHYLKANPNQSGDSIPSSTLPALLHGLELLLAHAHDRLQVDDMASPVAKAPEPPQGFFGNMVSGVFSAEGPPSKTSRTNSRLTMILCFQDAIRACFSIWTWASHGSESDEVDPTCAASVSLNGLKLRNRTRRILEHLFAAEGLEMLETLALAWVKPQSGISLADRNSVFSLFHVLEGSRPRNMVPIIFNALYSRTNMEALESTRRSSLTSDLTAGDVVAFLLAYTRTIEDDAMDEIWTDCTTFLRDVLGNPMPHRQILPSLLEFTVLLAEKVDNTNFGELRRMRRELSDIFLRLLTATFTSRGGAVDSGPSGTNIPDLIASLITIAPKLQLVLESNDRVLSAVNTISTNAIGPAFHAKSFPDNISEGHLRLLQEIARQSPGAKTWKKDIADAFNNPRLLASDLHVVEVGWYPVLSRWALSDKDRMPEIVSRITAPSTAGIMFGVGANAARLEADRRTQLNLRRIALLLLAGDQDIFMSSLPTIAEKLVEVSDADVSSSPSSVTRAEVFMVCRALILAFSPVHLSPLWPLINANLQAALMSVLPDDKDQPSYNNPSLLQACKLLDLLITVSPDEFQLHEWLYITDTIDAVYRPADFTPVALADDVAEALSAETTEQTNFDISNVAALPSVQGVRRPVLNKLEMDGADLKAMAREEFVRSVVQPFLSELSMGAYEATYEMGSVDLHSCRRGLLVDLLDEGTIA